MKIALIDYKAGNTQSVINALARMGIEPNLTADPEQILSADKVILPGVGHAGSAMRELHNRGLVDVIKSVTVPFLGVCVGMQIMMDWSEEGDTTCLGLVPGKILKFKSDTLKIPQMGWNTVSHSDSGVFTNIPQSSYFYFVHSFYLPTSPYETASCHFIDDYTVGVQKDNFHGVQFHPEKSAKYGAELLSNFIKL